MTDILKNLRNTMKNKRSKISLDYCTNSSQQICTRIQKLDYYLNAKNIAFYYAVNKEIDLSTLWLHAHLQGKICYFPVLNNNKTLSFFSATPDSFFKKNKYGILEPNRIGKAIHLELLDLILVPLLAFDMQCTRLGMGGGYYDRTFAQQQNSILLGVGYEFQKTQFIPAQPWDIPLKAVITPHALYKRDI